MSEKSGVTKLFEVNNITEYMRIVQNLYDGIFAFNNPPSKKHLFFRGHRCTDWKLLPSVFRNAKLNEHDIILDTKQFSQRLNLNYNFEFELPNALIDIQHNELPTRLLDWSVEPLKALYFCVESECDEDEDGHVWIFNPWKYNSKVIDYKIPRVHDAAILARALLGYGWKCCEIQEFLEKAFPKITVENAMSNFDEPVAFVGAFSVKRKIAQSGCFLIYGEDSIPFENNQKATDCLAYITVKNKRLIREQLNRLFINSFSVYPDYVGAKTQFERYGSFFNC
ncbi:FRG domain-containing protein [Treponema zioleckii]|uniref:FRG domain-containing protein n=1 Tax=Treponema zioleckii TaxID=331680 RepID=UPI00168ABD28|nr:FRG domain-containing protein [Treponema zioleckii]